MLPVYSDEQPRGSHFFPLFAAFHVRATSLSVAAASSLPHRVRTSALSAGSTLLLRFLNG